MRSRWADLVPRTGTYGGRAKIFFKAIHSLMSCQLNRLLTRSLQYLLTTIKRYEMKEKMKEYDMFDKNLRIKPIFTMNVSIVGVHFEDREDTEDRSQMRIIPTIYVYNENKDPNMLIKKPTNLYDFVRVQKPSPTIQFLQAHYGKIFVYPPRRALGKQFVDMFKMILKVGEKIPRLEYFMSHDEKQYGHLLNIPKRHVDMRRTYNIVRRIVKRNWHSIQVYLEPIYKYYYKLLTNQLLPQLEILFTMSTLPDLSVCNSQFHLKLKLIIGNDCNSISCSNALKSSSLAFNSFSYLKVAQLLWSNIYRKCNT